MNERPRGNQKATDGRKAREGIWLQRAHVSTAQKFTAEGNAKPHGSDEPYLLRDAWAPRELPRSERVLGKKGKNISGASYRTPVGECHAQLATESMAVWSEKCLRMA